VSRRLRSHGVVPALKVSIVSARGVAAVAALALAASGCSKPAGPSFEIGHHRVRLTAPEGWEHLDHGRTQVFRKGETQLVLEDLGPGTHHGVVRAIEAARSVWLAGRRADAFSMIRDLRGPPFWYTTSHARSEFWRPWWAMKSGFGEPDSASIGAAFDSLVARTEGLAPDSPDAMTRYAIETALQGRRYEVAPKATHPRTRSAWMQVETWDPATHLDRRRFAVFDDDGYLLALYTDRDPIGEAGPAFERLLASIEILPGSR